MLPSVVGEFRVVADPELRFAPSGVAVGSIRLVANSRKLNKQSGEWEDDKILWIDGVCFDKKAENMCESVMKGDLVVINGRLHTEEWEDRTSGDKRSKISMQIYDIGPSLAFATAKVSKTERVQGQGTAPAASGGTSAAPAADPWATPPAGDEPPF